MDERAIVSRSGVGYVISDFDDNGVAYIYRAGEPDGAYALCGHDDDREEGETDEAVLARMRHEIETGEGW